MDHALQLLRSIEVLLLLEQEDVAGNWNAANGLAVQSAGSSVDTRAIDFC